MFDSSVKQGKAQYIQACRDYIAEVNENFEPLIQYYRNKKNQRQGVVVALREKATGAIRYGGSLCSKKDTWNREIGLALAYKDTWGCHEVPHSLTPLFYYMIERAKRYFANKDERKQDVRCEVEEQTHG